jgi:hypothetical protein
MRFAGAFAAASILVLGVAPAAVAEESRVVHKVVHDTKSEGWTRSSTVCSSSSQLSAGPPTGTQAFVAGPDAKQPDGVGSLEMSIGTNTNTIERRQQSRYNGRLLSELTSLRYSTFVVYPQDPAFAVYAAPFAEIGLDHTGDGAVDDVLLYSPAYNTAVGGGGVAPRKWQRWDVLAAGAKYTVDGDPGEFYDEIKNPSGQVTLSEYVAARGGASKIRVAGDIRIGLGCLGDTATLTSPNPSANPTANSTSNIDSVHIAFEPTNNFVYDFEPAATTAKDSDAGSFRFSSAQYNTSEGIPKLVVTVQRAAATAGQKPTGVVSVDVTSTNGSATAGEDYSALAARLVFADEETEKTVEVSITDDSKGEPSEDFTLSLSNPQGGATLGEPSRAAVTIADNDGGPGSTSGSVVQLSSSTYQVAENAGTATVAVTRSGTTTSTATVSYAAANGTASAGSDYTSTSGTLTFAAGDTTKSVQVPVVNDTSAESTETFVFSLSAPSGGTQLGAPSSATVSITDDDRETSETVTRVSGASRYDTAVEISKSSFPTGASAGAVVLARGDQFVDALPGTALAVAKNGPLLLTQSETLTQAAEDEIKRVLSSGKTVFLMGGEVALSPTVRTRLESLGYQVVRFAGEDRYDTAAKVADTGLGNPKTVILTTGLNFPDALSAGSAAAKAGASVLLTAGSTMPATTRAYLDAHPPTTKYAVGGPSAQADPSAIAVVGEDRFDTARKVGETFFSSPTTVALASGETFPDSLAGGAHIGNRGGPLLLTQADRLTETIKSYLSANKAAVDTAFIYGGGAAVAGTVDDEVRAAIKD